MRRKIALGMIVIWCMMILAPQTARADVLSEGLPKVEANSFVVIEGSSGEILFGSNYTAQADPAGLVKMMTAVLAIEKGDMEKIITVGKIPSEKIQGTRTLMLREGEKIKLEALVKAIIIDSANDVAFAIADEIGGNESKFVDMMNEKAKELGMKNTTFTNVYGISEANQVTTAEDMAILGRYAMSLNVYREIARTKSFQWSGESFNGNLLSNTNPLLEIMPEAIGVKEGHSADGTYVTLVGAAQKDGRELIGVILGSASDSTAATTMQSILNHGFNNTKIVPIVQKDVAMTNISYGDNKQIRVVAGDNYNLVRPADNNAIVETHMTLDDIDLPIKKDQKVGILSILVDGTEIGQVQLVSLDDARGSINWLLIFTCIMTILYIAQMALRTYRMVRKSYLASGGRTKVQQSAERDRPVETSRPENANQRKSLSDRSNRSLDR